MAPGHVFVTQGDLTRLACDAWLLPTAEDLWAPVDSWYQHREDLARLRVHGTLTVSTPDGWDSDGVRTFRLEAAAPGLPQPWPTITGLGGRGPEWYAEAVRQFLEAAHDDIAQRNGSETREAQWRSVPLLGVPFIGTGAGGGHGKKAEIAEALLDVAYAFVATYPCDVVVIAFEPVAFAALQKARERSPRSDLAFSLLDDETRRHAQRLADLARRGELVTFVGAGLGQSAGLPGWGELLDRLADQLSIDGSVRSEFGELDFTDRAHVLQMMGRSTGFEATLGQQIQQAFAPFERYSLAHSLVTRLPVQHFVTTNYDQMLEWSAADQKHPLRVLGQGSDHERKRWLFKLHGCVTEPDEIVLSRQDYLRYEHRRGALEGIVQALLITQHMLFVGFSLTDPNFHRMIDEVRRLLDSTPSSSGHSSPDRVGAAGTAVFLEERILTRTLWESDLDIIVPGVDDENDAVDGRRVEIFLDFLLHRARDHHEYILDPTYDELLTDDEHRLRDLLRSIDRDLDAIQDPGLGRPIVEMLREYGLDR